MDKAVEFTAKHEGFSAKPYKDDKRGTSRIEYSIGYGSQLLFGPDGSRRPVTKNTPAISQEEALTQMERHYAFKVRPAVANTISPEVWSKLSDDQKVAVQDTIYNVGANSWSKSKALKALNNGDTEEFLNQTFGIKGWVRSGGKVNPGLVNRTLDRAKVWGVDPQTITKFWPSEYRTVVLNRMGAQDRGPLSREGDTGTPALVVGEQGAITGAPQEEDTQADPTFVPNSTSYTGDLPQDDPVFTPDQEQKSLTKVRPEDIPPVPEDEPLLPSRKPEAKKEPAPFSEEAGKNFFRSLGLEADYSNKNVDPHFAAGGEVTQRKSNMNQPTPDQALPEEVQTRNQPDDVPARLTAGEFVMPRVAVEYFGKDKLYKMIEQARAGTAERHKAQDKPSQGAAPAASPPPSDGPKMAPGFAMGGSVPPAPQAQDNSGLIAKLFGALQQRLAAGGEVRPRATTELINPATGGSYMAYVDDSGNPIKRADAPSAGGLGKPGPYKMYPEVALEDGSDGSDEEAPNASPGQFTAADIGQLQAALGGANWGNLKPQNIWSAVTARGKNEEGMDTYDFASISPDGQQSGGGEKDATGVDGAKEYADDIIKNTKPTVGEQTEHDLTEDDAPRASDIHRGMPTGQVFKHINPAPVRIPGVKYDAKTGIPEGMTKESWMSYLMDQFSAIDESK